MIKKWGILIGCGAAVGLQIEGDVEHGGHKLVLLAAVSSLSARDADGFSNLIGSVAQQQCRGRASVKGVGRENGRIHVGLTNIIQVICIRKPVKDLKTNVYAFIQSIFDSGSKRNGNSH